jgi:hypothetical protein
MKLVTPSSANEVGHTLVGAGLAPPGAAPCIFKCDSLETEDVFRRYHINGA